MTQYFEFKDDTSSKFWEITLEDNIVRTRYGKIGTDGKATEKELSDTTAALKEYDKLVKEKTQKGYTELTRQPGITYPQLITTATAKEKFDLSLYEPFDDFDFQNVIFLDGDVYIDGDMDHAWSVNTLKTLGKKGDTSDTLILINGNLTVAGTIQIAEDNYPFLLVLGNVKCDVLHSYDEFIYITGDADIKYAFNGNYNHGQIEVEGTTSVPYLLNSDHSSILKPEGAIVINYYGDYEDFFKYDYTEKDFEEVMVPAVFDEKGAFSVHQFIDLVKAGKSPLKAPQIKN